MKSFKEREQIIAKIIANLKENINSFVPQLKGVQCFPISLNVDNFPNLEVHRILSQKGM